MYAIALLRRFSAYRLREEANQTAQEIVAGGGIAISTYVDVALRSSCEYLFKFANAELGRTTTNFKNSSQFCNTSISFELT